MNVSIKKGFASKLFVAMFAVVVAAAMMFVAAPKIAVAGEAPAYTSTITVNNLATGDKATAYPIALATIDDSNNMTYTMTPGLPSAYDTIEELEAVVSDGYSYISNATAMQQAAAAIEQALVGNVTGYDVSAGALAPGYYLVVATGTGNGAMVYQNMIVDISPVPGDDGKYVAHDPVSLSVKSSPVTINKTSAEKGDTAKTPVKSVYNYSVGDAVPFTIETAVPDYPANATDATFKIVDTPSTGLKFDSNAGVKVMVGTNDMTSSFTVVANASGVLTIEWNKGAAALAALANSPVVITYNGIVTSEAFETAAADTNNSATLTFNPNPYVQSTSTTEPSEVDVVTFGFVFKKTTEAGAALPGAEYTIYDANGNKLGVDTADANGYVAFGALGAGKYTLKETNVPAGYQKHDFEVTLSAANCTTDNPKTTGVTETNFLNWTTDASKNVVDPDQPELPVTGGAGTFGLTLAGLALIGGAVFFLRRNRKETE